MDKNIKNSLYRAVSQLPRTSAATIWEQPIRQMQEHDYITRQPVIKAKSAYKRRAIGFATAFACFFLMFFAGFNWYGTNLAISTVVDLDVNPSIEISANSKEKVMSVKALNMEAEQILKQQNFKGEYLEDVVESITGILKANGYFSDLNNTVLLTVNSNNKADSNIIAQNLSGTIRLTADREENQVSVIRQTSTIDKNIEEQAQKRGVSQGKIRLVEELSKLIPQFTQEQLLELPLENLMEIFELLGEAAPESITVDASRFAQPQKSEPSQEAIPEITPTQTPSQTPPPTTIVEPKLTPTPPPPAPPQRDDDDNDDNDNDDNGDDNNNDDNGDDDNGDDDNNDDDDGDD